MKAGRMTMMPESDTIPAMSASVSGSASGAASLPLAVLAERVAHLRATLAEAQRIAQQPDGDSALSAASRLALKEDIIDAFKQADAALQEAQQLKERVKALAADWKQIAPPSSSVAPASSAAGMAATARVDHLGASTFVEKGWSKLSLGDPTGAEATLRKAIQLAPGHTEAETLLGWSLLLQGQLAPARQQLHAVLLRDPHNPLARATLGLLHLREGNPSEAIEQLTQALKSERDRKATLYAWLYLGMVYHEQAQYGDAEGAFRRALELGPNLVQAWYELGRTYWFAGRPNDAMVAWRDGAAANKFSPWGKRCADVMVEVEQGGAPPRID
jgi:tetratricopeptide (TPR) repeat protein